MKSAKDSHLELAELSCERWTWGFGALVVVGLLFETALAFAHPQSNSPWERWGPLVGNALVTIGVAGEVLFSRMGFARSRELTNRSQQKASEYETRAAEAQERTAQIEALTNWRRISREAHRQIVESLDGKFNNLDVLIQYQMSDPESFMYAREILGVLLDCGVKKIRQGANAFLSGDKFGLRISHAPNINISPILDAFKKASFEGCIDQIDLSVLLPRDQIPPDLYIFVAPKPPPIMLFEKDHGPRMRELNI